MQPEALRAGETLPGRRMLSALPSVCPAPPSALPGALLPTCVMPICPDCGGPTWTPARTGLPTPAST